MFNQYDPNFVLIQILFYVCMACPGQSPYYSTCNHLWGVEYSWWFSALCFSGFLKFKKKKWTCTSFAVEKSVKENQADVLLSKAASLGSLWHHLPQEGRAQSYLGWGDSCPSLLLCGCFPFMRVCLLCNTPVLKLWKWPRSMEAWLRRLTARETQGVEPSCSKPRVWEQLLTSVAAVPRCT